MLRRLCVLGGSLSLALSLVGEAPAGSPGRWTSVVEGPKAPSVSQELGVARTSDGVLNVAWSEDLADVRVRPITPAGQAGATTTIVSGWSLGADPTLIAGTSGLRVFFAGVIPIEGLVTATAPGAGGPWTTPTLVENAEFARGRTAGVATGPDGTPIQTWYSVGDIVVHRGLSPGGVVALSSGGTNVRPDIVTEASGSVFVAWCNFGPAGQGVLVRRVDPATASPIGAPVQLPGSTTEFQGAPQASCVLESEVSRREPIAARIGGGVFVAGTSGYPNLSRVLVWRVDASGSVASTMIAASAKSASYSEPAIAAAPDGRIWVAWLEPAGAGKRLVARRSNRAGTIFGAPVRASIAGLGVGTVNLSAQRDRVDVLGIIQLATGRSVQHTQLLPGLTLMRRGLVRARGGTASVTFSVLDAGEPVAGARVRAGGRSAVTGANGTAKLVLRRGGVATATKSGYVGASTRFKCCR
jgi:hypothetical protein